MTTKIISSKSIDEETIKFFNSIVQPSSIHYIKSLDELETEDGDKWLVSLWNLSRKNNLECFKLIGENKGNLWYLYYLDLETPILFYPTITKSIKFVDFKQFLSIGKTIKTNLLHNYSQETELIIVWLKKVENADNFTFHTFKVEDQQKKVTPNLSLTKGEATLNLEKGRKRVPFGTRNRKNKLNLYTGREWIKFSKSWFIHRPPSRKGTEILHPAKFPESMIRQFITFFTKPGEMVLDPFLGSGSTLLTAKQSNRKGIGIELSEKYAKISKQRLAKINVQAYPPLYQIEEPSFLKVILGDSQNLLNIWKENSFPQVDFCITSPPYWNQLERNEIRQKERKKLGLDTKYSEINLQDISNIKEYDEFLSKQQEIFGQVYEILRPKGYLVVITNNVFFSGKVYPLAYDTAISLTQDKAHPWVLKDEKIWLQDDKALVALGVNYAWVGNRCHQYCHIFRKE